MSTNFWEILLVDNDLSMHTIIKENLDGLNVFGKKIKVLHANYAKEAKQLIKGNQDIALAFVDIAMITPGAGLELVDYIRYDLHNRDMRVVILDSNDSPVPASTLIERYDINDYKNRTNIESKELFIYVRTALKQYEQFKELRANRDEIYKKMTTNEVTGLPNRMKLSENLGTIGKKSLILLNIDDFSVLNNHNGFEFGNAVLRAFGRFLQRRYAKYAKVFHMEADIFAMLCVQTDDLLSTEQNIAKIKDEIAQHLFSVNKTKIHITASIGIVLDDYGDIIQKAEFALKEARLYGKNNFKTYSDDLNILRTIHTNSLWTERIRNALEQDQILAYFQPIKNVKTGKIEKYETLVRINFEDKIYSPFHFLEAARYSGQLFEIFKKMFEEACKKVNSTDLNFTVNVSDYDLKHPKFMLYITKIAKRYRIDTHKITFEVLENNSISKENEIQTTLNKLHEFGYKIAIDDFGAECSNFGQLNNIHIDFIKIDGAFIKNIIDDKDSQIIAQTILDFAHQKNIPVVAEFVCSKEVCDYVKKMGVDYLQGYEISEPQPELLNLN